MTRTLTLAALMALALHDAHCEDAPKTLAFEVASIKPSKPGTPAGHAPPMVKWIYPGGRFTANGVSLQYLMEWAYAIIPEQHSGGPAWMNDQLFDVAAKAEGTPTDQEIKLMVRTMLATQFSLKFHAEQKEMPILSVSLGKTEPKFSLPKEGETHSIKIIPQMGSDPKTGSFHVVATCFTIEDLNETFARQLGRVIVDQTGIKGVRDFTMDFPFDEERPDPLDPANVINAMRDQLGLTLKSQKGLATLYAIESAEKPPASN